MGLVKWMKDLKTYEAQKIRNKIYFYDVITKHFLTIIEKYIEFDILLKCSLCLFD